jgi:plasmid stabilization system protein ParE
LSRIIRSDLANVDLEDIWDGLADRASLEIADFVIARLFEGMRRAADDPLAFARRSEFSGGPRRINVFEYAIFYEPLPEGDGIFVWRIIHGRRNLTRLVRRP